MPQPLSFRWPAEFVADLDAARGDVPRSTFVRRVMEQHLARRAAVQESLVAVPLTEALDMVPEVADRSGVPRSEVRRDMTMAACPACHSLGGHQRGCPKS